MVTTMNVMVRDVNWSNQYCIAKPLSKNLSLKHTTTHLQFNLAFGWWIKHYTVHKLIKDVTRCQASHSNKRCLSHMQVKKDGNVSCLCLSTKVTIWACQEISFTKDKDCNSSETNHQTYDYEVLSYRS